MTIMLLLAGVAPKIPGRLVKVWADWVEVNTYTVNKLAYISEIPEDQRTESGEKYQGPVFYENARIKPTYIIIGKLIEGDTKVSFDTRSGRFNPLEKGFLKNLRIKANSVMLVDEIEIIPLNEEVISDIKEKTKQLTAKWEKFEEEHQFTNKKEIEIIKLDEKKKNLRKLLFEKSEENLK